MKTLFSDFLGIPNTVGSDQPWRPPQCSKFDESIEEILDEKLKEFKGKETSKELKRNFTKGIDLINALIFVLV